MEWRADTEGVPLKYHDDHSLSKKFVILMEKAGPYYTVEFTASSG